MRRLYELLFTLGFWLSAPYYLLKLWRRGHWREGFRQRFGRHNAKVKQALTNLADTSRHLKETADSLRRNPSELIWGRTLPEKAIPDK